MTLPKTFRRIATVRTLSQNGAFVDWPDFQVNVTFTLIEKVSCAFYSYEFTTRSGITVSNGYPYVTVETDAFRDVVRCAAGGSIITSWTDPDAPAS